jgi:undecaprenyl-diphosphatase
MLSVRLFKQLRSVFNAKPHGTCYFHIFKFSHVHIVPLMDFQTKKILKEISVKTVVAALSFFIAVGIFAVIAHEIVFENEDWFDSRAFHFFNKYSTPGLIEVFKIITFFGSSYFLFPAYFVLVGWLLIRKRKRDAINIGIIGVTSTALMFAMKAIFHRHRPDLPLFKELTNYSFPSGHSLSSFIFCCVLIWLAWKTSWSKPWKYITSILLVLFSISIGISRIVLRYHYASDVLAGFCLGFAWVLFSFWLQKKFSRELPATASS